MTKACSTFSNGALPTNYHGQPRAVATDYLVLGVIGASIRGGNDNLRVGVVCACDIIVELGMLRLKELE